MGGLWSGVIESRRAQCRETRALEPLPRGQQHVRAAVAPIEYGVWALLQKCDLPDFGPAFMLGEEGNHKNVEISNRASPTAKPIQFCVCFHPGKITSTASWMAGRPPAILNGLRAAAEARRDCWIPRL